MGIIRKFFNQTRKPEGILGIIMLKGMNSGHAKLAEWGFKHLPALQPAEVVDLGCGAGRNAGEMLKMFKDAHVTAIDYSPLSVEKAKTYNRAMIDAGLPYSREMFRPWNSRKEVLILQQHSRQSISGQVWNSAFPGQPGY